MMIGIDARELEGEPAGVGVYVRNILQRITLPREAKLQLYFKKEIPQSLPAVEAEHILLKSDSMNFLWQQWILCRELNRRKVDLFFSPANSAPWHFRGIQVLAVHDISFFRNPEWFSHKERISRQLNTGCSVREADRIYTVSAYVRDELISRFRLPASRVLVTSNGVERRRFDPSERNTLRQTYRLCGRKVILYVGSVFNRRHVPVLIEAVSRMEPECFLVIIGRNRSHPYQDLAKIGKHFGVEQRLQLLDYAPDNMLHDYYRMADVFVYLSEYEGFGIPPLEAMSYSIPAVLSSTPAMDTIFHDAALFAKSISAEDVRTALEQCLNDATERTRLIRAGNALVEEYSWDRTAQVVSEDWERLLATRS